MEMTWRCLLAAFGADVGEREQAAQLLGLTSMLGCRGPASILRPRRRGVHGLVAVTVTLAESVTADGAKPDASSAAPRRRRYRWQLLRRLLSRA